MNKKFIIITDMPNHWTITENKDYSSLTPHYTNKKWFDAF